MLRINDLLSQCLKRGLACCLQVDAGVQAMTRPFPDQHLPFLPAMLEGSAQGEHRPAGTAALQWEQECRSCKPWFRGCSGSNNWLKLLPLLFSLLQWGRWEQHHLLKHLRILVRSTGHRMPLVSRLQTPPPPPPAVRPALLYAPEFKCHSPVSCTLVAPGELCCLPCPLIQQDALISGCCACSAGGPWGTAAAESVDVHPQVCTLPADSNAAGAHAVLPELHGRGPAPNLWRPRSCGGTPAATLLGSVTMAQMVSILRGILADNPALVEQVGLYSWTVLGNCIALATPQCLVHGWLQWHCGHAPVRVLCSVRVPHGYVGKAAPSRSGGQGDQRWE